MRKHDALVPPPQPLSPPQNLLRRTRRSAWREPALAPPPARAGGAGRRLSRVPTRRVRMLMLAPPPGRQCAVRDRLFRSPGGAHREFGISTTLLLVSAHRLQWLSTLRQARSTNRRRRPYPACRIVRAGLCAAARGVPSRALRRCRRRPTQDRCTFGRSPRPRLQAAPRLPASHGAERPAAFQ